MSDREFDNYLTLLSSLLRLSSRQRQAIADELRSHLEDRLDELINRGASREDAARQALAELGDAAGLAGQFLTISHNRKRRWLMRLTTFSVAATLLVAAGIAIFWPGRNAAPGVATALAQAAKNARGGASTEVAAASDEPSLQEKLNKRINVQFGPTPLRDALEYLKGETQIQFVISAKKIEEAGVNADTPVSLNLSRVRVRTVLEIMLKDLELRFMEKDELVFVTTPEDAESDMETRVYDCRDLLAMPAPPGADKYLPYLPPAAHSNISAKGGMFAVQDSTPAPGGTATSVQPGGIPGGMGGMGGSVSDGTGRRPLTEHDLRARRLMDIVEDSVNPDSWAAVGGPGSISEYNGLIIVTQTNDVHTKVEHVFDMLRQAAGLEVPTTGKVVR
jgi:hypothetical protein